MARTTVAQLAVLVASQQEEINSLRADLNALRGQKTSAPPKQPKVKADSTTYRFRTFAKANAAAARAKVAGMIPVLRKVDGGFSITV